MPEAVTSATPLLETKFHAPRRRPGSVVRPRLNNRLKRSEQPALTLVSAPAGFGKTTLLTQLFADVAGEEASTAWLALDSSDNDPVLFWSYVIAALQTLVPQIGTSALSLLRSAPTALEAVVATLLNDLNSVGRDIVV